MSEFEIGFVAGLLAWLAVEAIWSFVWHGIIKQEKSSNPS